MRRYVRRRWFHAFGRLRVVVPPRHEDSVGVDIAAMTSSDCHYSGLGAPQHFLYFFPLPHSHGEFSDCGSVLALAKERSRLRNLASKALTGGSC